MLCQSLARNDGRLSGFRPAVADILGKRAWVRVWLGPEAGPGIGQERVLVGLERQAPVATTRVNRSNRTAIAVQGIGGHHLPLERDQAKRFDGGLQFRTPIGRHAGQRQAQPRRIGRDHHPRPAALSRIAGPAQGLAVNGDHVAITKEGRDIGQHAPESRIERLGIDHPEHGREGVMRRNRVLELEETPENAFLCAPEGRHLGAGGRAAKDRHKGDDQQLTQVMSRVLGAGIGDIFEGGQDRHAFDQRIVRDHGDKCVECLGSGGDPVQPKQNCLIHAAHSLCRCAYVSPLWPCDRCPAPIASPSCTICKDFVAIWRRFPPPRSRRPSQSLHHSRSSPSTALGFDKRRRLLRLDM